MILQESMASVRRSSHVLGSTKNVTSHAAHWLLIEAEFTGLVTKAAIANIPTGGLYQSEGL